jgi:dihydrofolate reductase
MPSAYQGTGRCLTLLDAGVIMISIIAAMDQNRLIGVNNQLPWKLPADMRWFRRNTLGKPVIMGRKTFESLGKPLPDRPNIVVTRDTAFQAEGCRVFTDIEAALSYAATLGDELMVIGGASFYEQMLARADRLYLTMIHQAFEGDAWFPAYDVNDWRILQREDHNADVKTPFSYSFVVLERKK